MKRIFALIGIFICFFVGCNRTQEDIDRALAFRQNLLKQSGCQFVCSLTADYGEILYQFGLECTADNKGNVSFTVSAPETISGITGTISSSGGTISFDDSVLGFPLLSEDLPTPLSAPWLFLTALRSGYIRTCEVNKGVMSLSIADTYEEDGIMMNIKFDEQEKPVSCEFFWKGRRILSMLIASFHYL